MNKKSYILFSLIFFFCSLTFISSAVTGNATQADEATVCLNESQEIMNFMTSQNFNVLRINDTLKQATLMYDSQKILQARRANYDFSAVIGYCNDIKEIKENAIEARDQFSALLKFYERTFEDENMNTSSVDILIAQIDGEIKDERYENVPDLVTKTYDEITKVKSSYTAANVINKNLKSFFIRNWKAISITLIAIIIPLIIFRIPLTKYLINRKMEKLKIRKKTIKELVMQTQKDYFQYGKIPEGEYNIKTKKFAELVRDIDRQIPLLQEELAKLNTKRNFKKV